MNITEENLHINATIVQQLYDDLCDNMDSVKMTKCMEYANKIITYVDALDNDKIMNIKEYILDVYVIAADMMLNNIGMHTNRKEFNRVELLSIDICIKYLEKVISINPDHGKAQLLYKITYTVLAYFTEKFSDKLKLLDKIRQVQPYDFELQYNTAIAYQMTNNIEKAIEHFKLSMSIIKMQKKMLSDELLAKAAKQMEDIHVKCLIRLGSIYYEQLDFILTEYYLYKAFESNTTDIEVNNQLGIMHAQFQCLDKAIYHYKRAIKEILTMNINDTKMLANIYTNMGNAYANQSEFDKAIDYFDKALMYEPDLRAAFQNKLLYANNLAHTYDDPMYITNMHKQFKEYMPTIKQLTTGYTPNECIIKWDNGNKCDLIGKKKLNIGFVSADFFGHVVSFFLHGIFNHIDYELFNVICYSSSTLIKSEMFPHITWKVIKDMSTEDVCKIIETDKIDILFDMSGCTSGARLDVFALKPAPIQITYCGYPNTTGLENMDYRIVDKYCDSDGITAGAGGIIRPSTQKYYTEKLLFMNKCFLTFMHLSDLPKLAHQPVLKKGHITLGCFNRFNKYNDKLISVWKRILKKCPTVHLVVKTKEFNTPYIRDKFLKFWDKEELARIQVMPFLQTLKEHYECYNDIDIALDTFPYSGTTTTCEALTMGVPVLTLFDSERQYHVQNVSTSLLANSGLSEFICYSEDEYVDKIEYYVHNVHKLEDIKPIIRHKFIKNICNHKEFTEELEDKLLYIYKDHDWSRYN
jgi:predicted O-linked N-acetylglucosamine transferase (SPINDLY family)